MKHRILAIVMVLAAGVGTATADCPKPSGLAACMACHALEPGKPSRDSGPNLFGAAGQPAMHATDFKGYSEAMRAAQAKGLVWSDENLMNYIADPKTFLAQFNGQSLNNAMAFQLKDAAKRKAVVDGLKQISACN